MHGLFSVNTDVQVFYIWIIILHISTIILCQVIDWPATIILFVTVYYMNYLMTFPRWPRILCLESSQSRARRTKSRGISRPPWRRSPQTAESTCSSSLVTRPCSCDIYIWRYTRLRIVITYIATLLLSIIIHKSSLISVEIAKWMFQSYLPISLCSHSHLHAIQHRIFWYEQLSLLSIVDPFPMVSPIYNTIRFGANSFINRKCWKLSKKSAFDFEN